MLLYIFRCQYSFSIHIWLFLFMMNILYRIWVILALSLLTALVIIAEWPEEQEFKTDHVITITQSNSWSYLVEEEVFVEPYEEKDIEIKPVVKPVTYSNAEWKKESDAQKEYTWWEVQQLIRFYSERYWYDTELALRIAWCESWYRYNAKNWTSTAWWVFQFLVGTWKSSSAHYWRWGESRFNADANIDVAIQKLKNEWTSARVSSRYCWHR